MVDTVEELKAKFAAHGFRCQVMTITGEPIRLLFYRPAKSEKLCKANELLQLNVDAICFDDIWRFSIGINACFDNTDRELWSKLSIYSLEEETLFQQLPRFEAALVRAWEALA